MPFIWFFIFGFGWSGIALFLISIISVSQMLKYLSYDKPNGYMIHWVRFNMPKAFIAFSLKFKGKQTLIEKQSLYKRASVLPPAHFRHIAG